MHAFQSEHGEQDKMVKSTQIARIDGLLLAATVDDEQAETELADPKANAKMIIRRLNRNSEPQASIEAGKYTLQYVCLPSLFCERTVADFFGGIAVT